MRSSSAGSWRDQQVNKRQIALVHVAKARLGLDNTTYRAMLASVGVESSKDLTLAQLDELMKRFEAGGFVGQRSSGSVSRSQSSANADTDTETDTGSARRSTHRSAARSGMDKSVPEDKKRLFAKIEAILADMGLPWAYADGIAKNVCGVDKVRWCDNGQLYKVAQVLAIYQGRKNRKSVRAGKRKSDKRLTHMVNKTCGVPADADQG